MSQDDVWLDLWYDYVDNLDLRGCCVSKTDRKSSTTRLVCPLSIKQIQEMSDGGIKDAARNISTNLQPSLPKQFAIEKQ